MSLSRNKRTIERKKRVKQAATRLSRRTVRVRVSPRPSHFSGLSAALTTSLFRSKTRPLLDVYRTKLGEIRDFRTYHQEIRLKRQLIATYIRDVDVLVVVRQLPAGRTDLLVIGQLDIEHTRHR